MRNELRKTSDDYKRGGGGEALAEARKRVTRERRGGEGRKFQGMRKRGKKKRRRGPALRARLKKETAIKPAKKGGHRNLGGGALGQHLQHPGGETRTFVWKKKRERER